MGQERYCKTKVSYPSIHHTLFELKSSDLQSPISEVATVAAGKSDFQVLYSVSASQSVLVTPVEVIEAPLMTS